MSEGTGRLRVFVIAPEKIAPEKSHKTRARPSPLRGFKVGKSFLDLGLNCGWCVASFVCIAGRIFDGQT
jgi:hypothetical protein